MPLMEMEHETDPKQEVRNRVGDLSSFKIFGNQVLVGVYQRPKKTKSGLYLSDETRKEDEFQGKIGLVLKLGPEAFVSDASRDFKGQKVDVGDWVGFKIGDSWPLAINNRDGLCRMVDDIDIRISPEFPDQVW